MGVRAGARVLALMTIVCGSVTAPALADGPVGADPSQNFSVGALPSACWSDPTGATCVTAAVGYLDQARASLGQPPYALPPDFASLSPAQQAFVLTNSDRVLFGLPPVPGLTEALDQDAAGGVASDSDPQPSDSVWYGYTANWAGGYENIVLAYETWMYDDGPGSENLDCTPLDSSGCWGHRHDILWRCGGAGPLAMGAAAGTDGGGSPGYAMLLEHDAPGYAPTYTYTWAQAVADGAGGAGGTSGSGATSPSAPAPDGNEAVPSAGALTSAPAPIARTAEAPIKIETIDVRGHRVSLVIVAALGTRLRCVLTGRGRLGRRISRSKLCSDGTGTTFRHLPAGRYHLRIISALGILTRRVVVR
jgi:hypothetical protein